MPHAMDAMELLLPVLTVPLIMSLQAMVLLVKPVLSTSTLLKAILLVQLVMLLVMTAQMLILLVLLAQLTTSQSHPTQLAKLVL